MIEVVDEVTGVVFEFATQTDCDTWALTGELTFTKARPATREELAYARQAVDAAI